MKKLSIVFMVLALTACTKPYSSSQTQPQSQSYWTKPNYTQAAFNSDRYQCLQSAIAQSQPNNSVVVPDINSQLLQIANQNNLFNACMQFKGYSLQTANTAVSTTISNDRPATLSNEENAYCLQVYKISLKGAENAFKDDNDPKSAPGREFVLNEIKNHINSSKENLASNGLFSLESDEISPELLPQMKQAKTDNNVILHDKHHQCVALCPSPATSDPDILKKWANCAQECDKYMSETDKKYLRCITGG